MAVIVENDDFLVPNDLTCKKKRLKNFYTLKFENPISAHLIEYKELLKFQYCQY